MLKILIVDDREDVRTTLREIIEENLPEGSTVAVEDIFPFEDVKAYASHIREHDFAALLLDERLNELKNPVTGKHIPYFGHDVVGHLRAALPDFPVYVVTTWRTEQDLVAKEAEFEDVVERDVFQKTPHKYTSRIQRAATRFQEAMQQHLDTLNNLTLKAARGALTAEEQKLLSSARQVLGLPFAADSDLLVSDLIAEARNLASESEDLIARIRKESAKK
jgi:CheY-like chemotaxis protein